MLSIALPGVANGTFNVVAVTGEPLPGGGGTWVNPIGPGINAQGQVVIDNLGSHVVVDSGGSPAVLVGSIDNGPYALDDSGGLLVGVNGRRGGPASIAYQANGAGGLTTILPSISAVTSLGEDILAPRLDSMIAADSGRFAVLADIDAAGGSEKAIVIGTPAGTFDVLARPGPAPGGGTFSSFLTAGDINRADGALFTAGVDLPGQGVVNSVFVKHGGAALAPLFRVGDPTPDGGGTITGLGGGQINDAGDILVSATVDEGFGPTTGLFRTDTTAQSWFNVMEYGQPSPNGNGVIDRPYEWTLGDTGDVAFLGGIIRPDGGGLEMMVWDEGTESLTSLTPAGELSPDGASHFSDTPIRSPFGSQPTLNAHGQLAFVADLVDAQDPNNEFDALFFYDPDTGIREIVRRGEEIGGRVNLGIAYDPFDGLNHAERLTDSINEAGQVAFYYSVMREDGGSDAAAAVWSPWTPGDYNASGQVEQGDLDLVLQNWGRDTVANGIPTGWTNDLPDGLIDQSELDGVLLNWGGTASPDFSGASNVPEPGALVWSGLLLGLIRRPRYRVG